MKHSRKDYQNRIIDLSGKIPDDEPVFVLRAKDSCSGSAIHAYLFQLVSEGASVEMLNSVRSAMEAFATWQLNNTGLIKTPDIGEAAELPKADHPLLAKALSDNDKLNEEHNRTLDMLTGVSIELEEWKERYADMKSLYVSAKENARTYSGMLGAAEDELKLKKGELQQLKFDFDKTDASLSGSQIRFSDMEKSYADCKEKYEKSLQTISDLEAKLLAI